MAIDEKAVEEFLDSGAESAEVPAEALEILERIWQHNDALGGRGVPGHKSRAASVKFIRAQGVQCSGYKLMLWSKRAGRQSWEKK